MLPTTSQATPDAFMKEFEKTKESGEAAVVITLASKFSGTYQSAAIAAEEYENVYVIDSASATVGSGRCSSSNLFLLTRPEWGAT